MTIVAPQECVPTSVYRYYDRHGLLLYVGITSRGIARNREHNTSKAWWVRVARQEVEHFASRSVAEKRERSLIREFRPPYNIQHNPDRGSLRPVYEEAAGNAERMEYRAALRLLQKVKKRVPLVVHRSTPNSVTYRLAPSFAHLAAFMTFEQPVMLLAPKKLGLAQGAQIVDGHATFHFVTKRPLPALDGPALLVKIVSQKAPIHLVPHEIRAVLRD